MINKTKVKRLLILRYGYLFICFSLYNFYYLFATWAWIDLDLDLNLKLLCVRANLLSPFDQSSLILVQISLIYIVAEYRIDKLYIIALNYLKNPRVTFELTKYWILHLKVYIFIIMNLMVIICFETWACILCFFGFINMYLMYLYTMSAYLMHIKNCKLFQNMTSKLCDGKTNWK